MGGKRATLLFNSFHSSVNLRAACFLLPGLPYHKGIWNTNQALQSERSMQKCSLEKGNEDYSWDIFACTLPFLCYLC